LTDHTPTDDFPSRHDWVSGRVPSHGFVTSINFPLSPAARANFPPHEKTNEQTRCFHKPTPLADSKGYGWTRVGDAGTLEQEEFCESRGSRTFAQNAITASAEYHARDVKSVVGLNDGDVVAFVVEVWP
jgi:hypothetical protein